MASAAILLIMVGCAVAQYLKGGLVKSFLTLISALLASFVALWWYEQASVFVVKQEIMVDFAQPACFGMIFVISFAILQTAAMAISKQKIDFGDKPERIGRVVSGLLLGYVISGVLLIGVSMAPLPSEYPYQRFDGNKRDLQKASGALLNPDGFLSGFFGIISGGSVGGTQSFAVLHAGFVDELSLNRLNSKSSLLADPAGVVMQAKSVWPAPAGLKDTEGKAISPTAGHDLIIARVGFTGKANTIFAGGQLRFMCKKKGEKPRLQGSAITVYPVGYLKSGNEVKRIQPGEQITPETKSQGGVMSVDFVCDIPREDEPVAVGLKTNVIAEVPPMVAADQTPKESNPVSEKPVAPKDANAAK